MGNDKKSGRSYVSTSVDVRTAQGLGKSSKTTTLKLSQKYKRAREAKRYRLEHISGLSFEQRDELMNMDKGQGGHNDGWEDEEGMYTIPPGEEGMFLSHAGGEDELCQSLLEEPPHKRYDARTQHDRTDKRNKAWAAQLNELVAAYMTWQANLEPGEDSAAHDADAPAIEITAVDFFDTTRRSFRRVSTATQANVALVAAGYLGTSPTTPSVAVSFQVFEAYRQYHRVCPRLSIQAHVHALCHLHKIPYWKGLVQEFSHSFDVYLSILDGIDRRVRTLLKQDTPAWRMRNACAPCLYVLEGEARLQYSILTTVDGNQSLKLVDSAFRAGTPLADFRQARTDFWIPPAEVDRFKDEVGQAKKIAAAQNTAEGDASADIVLEGLDAEGSSPQEAASICVERWRNAGPEARKKMFALFAVSGIFVCLCRHGHILIMCNMIRSGELMKYALAIMNRLLEVYGPDVLVGYDIGCEFSKTLENSCLGARAKEKRLECIVPAFHGHSHNRGCQVRFLPLYRPGVGKEDFEGCERLFSESNALAPGTRLSTPFHRHQAIEQFATFWSHQKHAESGTFIFNNYKQAVDIISTDTAAFDVFAAQLHITHDDCERYLREEREYLAKPAKKAADSLDLFIPPGPEASKRKTEIARIRTRARTAFSRYQLAEEEALGMEEDLGIVERWVPGSPNYVEWARELGYRRYRCALDSLERLVIQRMFELTKLGMSGIGYKMREKIGKALKTRAEAIRNALTEYNRCAAALKPPRAQLSWNDVMEMTSLAEFDLLRDAREDVRQYDWAKRLHRQAMNLHFNIKRAHEEIERLNVEIPRLFTYMVDRHYDLQQAIAATSSTDPALSYELRTRWEYEDRISARITGRLYATAQLKGFTGMLTAGRRVGREVADLDGLSMPSWACHAPTADGSGLGRDTDDDACSDTEIAGVEDERDALNLLDFVDGLGRDAGPE
ncbi:hypothetical protein K466DRAFT_605604 [Polyporus arcularius HHB13444]|uniref:CxC1-like cysteine cluster associated with KDZ transposases domain-containing protein n=1 Tax=Polyporus arcularius HHB13444 TaxID=1314778 RepID=A0A5C3NTL0_9APHY|nr:hypothetical protein K466DRAFT_605604 [Polyporus arcularius HHB13444]